MAELRWAVATDVGMVREANEDAAHAAPGLFVVADGMGGHQAGEVASEIAVTELRTKLEGADELALASLVEAVSDANRAIFGAAQTNDEHSGMGTTITALAVVADRIDGEVLALANVGDSRAYLLRNRRLRQLSVDHNYVQELVAEGYITREEARHHPRRNIVTRALGVEPSVRVDSWSLPIVRGDRYLLCSDGLNDEVTDDDIGRILAEHDEPQAAADALVAAAKSAGGHDNITVVIVDVLEGLDPPDPTEEIDVVPTWATGGPAAATLAIDDETAATSTIDTLAPPDGTPPDGTPVDTAAPRRRRRVATFLTVVGVIAVLVLGFTILAAWARGGYFVAFDDDDVVTIYAGQPDGVLWFDPTVEVASDLTRDQLEDESVALVEAQPEFESRRNAIIFVTEGLSTTTTTTVPPTTTTTTTTTVPPTTAPATPTTPPGTTPP